MIEREFLTLEEAADYLRVSKEWLRGSDCDRVRLGRRIVFYVEDLRTFALNRRMIAGQATRLAVVPEVRIA